MVSQKPCDVCCFFAAVTSLVDHETNSATFTLVVVRRYESMGATAWTSSVVPNFVTSNAFLAACYAKVLLAFMRDWFARPDARKDAPVHIFEIGAGHGRLSFLALRELLDARDEWPKMAPGVPAPFVWVITDFTEANVSFCANHERLRPFIEAGLADTAVFNAEVDDSLTLRHSGRRITPGSLPAPSAAIANYIFDTLRQDAFRVVEGQLQEALAAVYTDHPEDAADPSHPDVIRRMRVAWEYRPIAPEAAYPDDPALATALRVYAGRTRNASIMVPVGGLRAVRTVAAFSAGGRVLAICGDKAYNHEEEVLGLRDPHVAVHGSFSLMVNFHAVRLAVLAQGGFSLHTPQLDGFKVSAFVVGCAASSGAAGAAVGRAGAAAGGSSDAASAGAGTGAGAVASASPLLSADEVSSLSDVTVPPCALAFPRLLCTWADTMDTFGPDNFATLQRCVRDELPSQSLKTALATIRLSRWDGDVFLKFKQLLIDRAAGCTDRQAADLYLDVARVAERHYPLCPSKDVAFELGRICMGLRRYGDAIALFRDSIRQCGDHHVTQYNIGISLFYRGAYTEALAAFDISIGLRADYADAINWRTRVQAKLQGQDFLRAHAAGGAIPHDEAPAASDVSARSGVATQDGESTAASHAEE